jgi:PAS domain S-box-containing protein
MKKSDEEQKRKAPAKKRRTAKAPCPAAAAAKLRSRAESRLPKQGKTPEATKAPPSEADSQRLLHELQVHQIELEMQNAELQESRDLAEWLLDKYTNLYDFAPVGYLSLDRTGRILEANLTGSALLGVERASLLSRSLRRFVARNSRPVFLDFLARIFAGAAQQACEAEILKEDGASFWASLHGGGPDSPDTPHDACRVAITDITALRQAQETRRRLEAVSALNAEMEREIARRQAVEEALRESESHQRDLLEQSRHMQAQLQAMSHRLLQVREEERKRISRDLHDEISQTLAGINLQLEALSRESALTPQALKQRVARTKRLVEKSVTIIHQFAVELRPTSLDDLGLIVTLNVFLNDFLQQTGIRVHLTAFAAADELNNEQRTMLYRTVQTALANVAQHSRASRVTVNLRRQADTVQLDIADDGEAFDVERVLRLKRSKHLGLIDMRERAKLLGGTFAIESEPGKGTTIHVRIPVRQGPPQEVDDIGS